MRTRLDRRGASAARAMLMIGSILVRRSQFALAQSLRDTLYLRPCLGTAPLHQRDVVGVLPLHDRGDKARAILAAAIPLSHGAPIAHQPENVQVLEPRQI